MPVLSLPFFVQAKPDDDARGTNERKKKSHECLILRLGDLAKRRAQCYRVVVMQALLSIFLVISEVFDDFGLNSLKLVATLISLALAMLVLIFVWINILTGI